MLVICDTEMNGLDPTRVWVIVCKNPETQEVRIFREENLSEFAEYAKSVTTWVGHYFIRYDLPNLCRLVPSLSIDPRSVLDTCIVSKLLNAGIEGGHSVEAWAQRLHMPMQKVPISQWDVFTEDMVTRCVTDVEIQERLYKYFLKWINMPEFKDALRLEHDMEWVMHTMHANGFPFDTPSAEALLAEITERLAEIDGQMQVDFPPIQVLERELVVRETKQGTVNHHDYKAAIKAGYTPAEIIPGAVLPIHSTSVFNPGSIKQTIDRLWDAGWKPTEKTKGHAEATGYKSRSNPKSAEQMDRFKRYGWKLSEENLRTLPDNSPRSYQRLVERLLLAGRDGDLREWLRLVRNDADQVSRLHANFNGIGAWTHRLSSDNPNMQNIPVPQHKKNPTAVEILSDSLSERMRALFVPEPGCVLVGTDASGIQMRIFAHYVQDERLTKALIEGKSEDGTDIHTLHWKALGDACKGRNPAKTFIYAWLLGAGVGKVAEILECPTPAAKRAIDSFLSFYPGLLELKRSRIPADAERGYFVGLDGRLVMCDDPHYVLAGYLQNGEVIIMKRAQRIWERTLQEQGIYYKLHTWPHDEWQTSAHPEDASEVGRIQADAIRIAAEELNMNLPFAGEYRVGTSWAQTH